MAVIVETMFPILAVVALGYGLANRPWLDASSLANLTLFVSAPALVFDLFHRADFAASDWMELGLGTVAIMAITGLGAAAWVRRLPRSRRGLLLPCIFWNSGNLGLSVLRLARGDEALIAGALVFATVALANVIAGTWIAKGRGGGGEVLRMPLFWGALTGLFCSWSGVSLPRLVVQPIHMVGSLAIPTMLLTLGMQLRRLRIAETPLAVVAVAIRMAGGLAAALVIVTVLRIEGVNREVLMIEGALPPAVINVVFARRYDADPELVASAIVIGTVVSFGLIPVLLAVV